MNTGLSHAYHQKFDGRSFVALAQFSFCSTTKTMSMAPPMSPPKQDNLLFAIPKKGRLYESVVKLLNGAGLDYNRVCWSFLERNAVFILQLLAQPPRYCAVLVPAGDARLPPGLGHCHVRRRG